MWEDNKFISDELNAFELYLKSKYVGKNNFASNASRDIIESGGKRLRPTLLMITSMMGEYNRDRVFPAAAAIETLHTATLIHDDIIDSSAKRRGKITLSEKNGINLAVYTGDYLLANSILLLAEAGLTADKLEYVARAAKLICLGEVEQYFNRFTLTSISGYLRRVMKKTGILFSASCALGACIAGCDEKLVNTMGKFGMNLGVAFQIQDDILDLESNESKEGKPVLKDIREGIATIPFLFAARQSKKVYDQITSFFNGNGEITDLLLEVVDNGGIYEAKELKKRYISRCRVFMDAIPKDNNRSALNEVLNWL